MRKLIFRILIFCLFLFISGCIEEECEKKCAPAFQQCMQNAASTDDACRELLGYDSAVCDVTYNAMSDSCFNKRDECENWCIAIATGQIA